MALEVSEADFAEVIARRKMSPPANPLPPSPGPAETSGGGRIIIAWGAIVFGGIQFIRGMTQPKHNS
jgi:hypothetical protein